MTGRQYLIPKPDKGEISRHLGCLYCELIKKISGLRTKKMWIVRAVLIMEFSLAGVIRLITITVNYS